MRKENRRADGCKEQLARAEARARQAEARTEQAKSRAELAETRTEQAETRIELAKTRTEQAETRIGQAETRAEQAEIALQRVVHQKVGLGQEIPARLLKDIPENGTAKENDPLKRLTDRQREILQLIAEGKNTKQIAEVLKVSPKTVEYHRMRLMKGLNLHDIPSLVRFALRAGLVTLEN